MKGGRVLPFLSRGSPHVALGLLAAAAAGDEQCCVKSVYDEASAKVPALGW